MANYIIEGTITELKIEGTECTFKIFGTEGYAVKRNKTSYNLLCSTENDTNANVVSAYILFTERTYKTSEIQLALLSSSLIGGKRVRITIDANEDEIKRNGSPLKVTSLTLLAD